MEDGGYMADQTQTNELLALTTDIVSSHVSNNPVQGAELPQLIQNVFSALATVGSGAAGSRPRPEPAVSVPSEKLTRPRATATAEPPLDPAGMRAGFQ